MVIRVTSTSEFEPLEDMIEFVDNLSLVNEQVLVEAANEVEGPFMRELRTEAPPRSPGDYPINWTSERQQIAFWATNGFGRGIPTGRTGETSAGWRMGVSRDGRSALFEVENTTPHARFVGGSLAQNIQQAVRFQQRFHREQGWQQYAETVAFWLDALDERYRERLDRTIADFGQGRLNRRAFTSRLPRRRFRR